VCPECGNALRKRRTLAPVRCALCGEPAYRGLRICPECGNPLRPARTLQLVAAGLALLLIVGAYFSVRAASSDRSATKALAQVTLTPTAPDRTSLERVEKEPPARQPIVEAGAMPTGALASSGPPATQVISSAASSVPAATATRTATVPSPESTPTATDTLTPMPLAEPTATVTSTPTLALPTATATATHTPLPPTSTLTATATSQPTATLPAPTRTLTPALLPAVQLLSPAEGEQFGGSESQIWLSWQAAGELAQDAWYSVSLRYVANGATQYQGTWQKDTRWRVPAELHQKADPAQPAYLWDVTIMRQTGTRPDGGREGLPISETSETRRFFWQ
jgi:hypothetical protein